MVINFVFVPSVNAEDKPTFISKFKDFIFDAPPDKEFINPVRPTSGKAVNDCIQTLSQDHHPLMERIGSKARHMANNLDAREESLSFQPHFSGLKGPKITIMRRDLEHALVNNKGSANEIYHNATFTPATRTACNKTVKHTWDVEIKHHIDVHDSYRSPLFRSNIIINDRVHFGGYFLGTTSINTPLYNNLDRERDLNILNRTDPIRQDVLGFAYQGFNIDRLMLSGFATPLPNLYASAHAGYLEEMFFGVGGELLYRPSDSPFAVGVEAWHTARRYPYLGGLLNVNDDQRQTSALLNLWADMPDYPVTLGLSAGRFLDGDTGIQAKTIYKPAQGWRVEGFATLSNEEDQTLKNKNTNVFAGLKVTMPLGQFKKLPDNSRQTFEFKPFARDKGQRINNPYTLYDLTDTWQTKQLHKYWNKVTE